MSTRLSAAVVAALSVLLTLVAAPATAAAPNPVPHPIRFAPWGEDSSFPAAYARSITDPDRDPLGANDWGCQPSAAHPRPVVLVHGTFENAYANWNGLAPILADRGYCVFALNYGNSTGIAFLNGTGDLIANAHEIGPFVDRVLASTGAAQIDLVGHSQGGVISRYYANLIAPQKVNQVIGLAPSNHPTTLSGITEFGKLVRLFGAAMAVLELVNLPAAAQQADQSPAPQAPFYQQVNGDGETIPGMSYTTIVTRRDQVVTPWQRGQLATGPGAEVENIVIQDVCRIDQSEHVSLPFSKNVAQIVLNTLDPDDERRIRCYPQAPITGSTQLIG
ncbi:alpha/beta fold hydrolase [Aeromicrobium phragmitis]|uniref:Alpha/beta fold hydrolase n=1 Tax=Aeromicrobium phragmitis TaxID=2478914 RepID=A0A3L8PHD9_9ACTN|nr:alpha/beta fold hydrolase [Aeromicrobium phragmitis]RLV54615.1 alpha/beta fold hydrolase [Aeromicrobium phragmitis]